MIIAGIDPNKTKIAVALYNTLSEGLELHCFTTKLGSRTQQLWELGVQTRQFCKDAHQVYIEEPLIGRSVRSSLYVAQTAGAVGSYLLVPGYYVSNSAWKKSVVGMGNANKATVSSWLNTNHVTYAALCDGDQDLIDATCLALYGAGVQDVASRLTAH